MNEFLKRSAIFTGILMLYLGINFGVNSLIINNSELPIEKSSLLIAGDSHTRNALIPGLFRSAKNISQTAEPYLITYLKLKYIFRYFKPDTLILGFAHHNISGFNDLKFSNNTWSSEMFRRTYLFRDALMEIRDIEIDRNELNNIYLRNMCLYPKPNHVNFIEPYQGTNRRDTRGVKEVIDSHYYIEGNYAGISEVSIQYADSILNLCKQHHIIPVLVGTPLMQEYANKIPAGIINRYEELKLSYKQRNILVLDYTREHFDDDYYINADHLNERGATMFTKQVQETLRTLNQ